MKYSWGILLFRIDADFSAKARVQMLSDGSTAVVAIIHGKKVYVGNGK